MKRINLHKSPFLRENVMKRDYISQKMCTFAVVRTND